MSTLINNAVTFGASAGDASEPTKTSLAADTTAFFLNVKVTNPVINKEFPQRFTLHHTTSPYDLTAGAAPAALNAASEILEIDMYDKSPGAEQVFKTSVQVNNGGYLYTWYEHPNMGKDVTVDLTLVEI